LTAGALVISAEAAVEKESTPAMTAGSEGMRMQQLLRKDWSP